MNHIKHFLVEAPTSLRLFLAEKAMIPMADADFLISMGAVYKNRLRMVGDEVLSAGDLIRCHTRPRRFVSEMKGDKHILFENNDFMIVDKPAGLPCQASLDNRIENVLYILSQCTQQKLLITHRLDVGTEGLLVIAKNQVFQRNFNHQLETRQVVKIYQALTLGAPLFPGKISHWMLSHPRAPKILKPIEEDNRTKGTDNRGSIANKDKRGIEWHQWKHCELEILNWESIPAHHILPLPEQTNHDPLNLYRLQLHTGRTHQIRAQLSFMNNPIIGDTLYGGSPYCKDAATEGLPNYPKNEAHPSTFIERYALRCSEIHFTYQGVAFHFHQTENSNSPFFKEIHC